LLTFRRFDIQTMFKQMKPIASYIVCFFLFLYPAISAQPQEDGTSVNITASATVVGNGIDLETISDIGIVQASQLQNGDVIVINPVFDAEAGIMRARGEPGAEIRVSYLSEMEVARREGPGMITFYYEVSGYPGDSQRESELLDLLEREVRFNEEGLFYFWIGGHIDLSEALPGNYDGEFTIEIEYM